MGNEAPLIEGLDPARVGEALMRLPAAAAMLRHANLQSALGYVAEGDPEQEYVRDVLTLTVKEVITKWHGGQLAATGMATSLVADAINAHRKNIPRYDEPG